MKLLRLATAKGSDCTLAGLQELSGFRQLDSTDVRLLMRSTLVAAAASTKRSGLMEPYADHLAAAALTQAELVVTGLEQQCEVPEFFAALMRLPAGRQLGMEQVLELAQAAVSKGCAAALPALLSSPGARGIDAAAALQLVRAAAGMGPGACAVESCWLRLTSAVLAGLHRAVAAQFSEEDVQGLLFQALRQGSGDVQTVLAAHFGAAVCTAGSAEGAAASGGGDSDLAAVCGAVRLLEGRTYPFPHEELP